MGKLLLLVTIGIVAWWLWCKLQRKHSEAATTPVSRPAELMVACAHCGVNQPRGECVESGGRLYCSEVHRQAAEHGSHDA
jgi:uncharacterized protein